MTSLAQIIAGLDRREDGWHGTIPDTWLQGRTAYGGLSAALALHAAQASDTDLPPLRSAQVSFIGPLAGEVVIRAQRLRRGRNAAWMQADVESGAGLGLRATFIFMGPVPSTIEHHAGAAPDFPRPGPGAQTFRGIKAVTFTQHFEMLDLRDGSTGPAEWLRWARLNERDGLDPTVELVAVADCLPPSALKLFGAPAPVSSMTWLLNLLDTPRTEDGWWLLRADTDHVSAGASSQRMAIWNAAGEPVGEQMQSVAVFA